MHQIPFDPTIMLISMTGTIAILITILSILLLIGQKKYSDKISESHEKTRRLEKEISELKGGMQTLADITVTRQSEVSRNLHERLDNVGNHLNQNLNQNAQKTAESLEKLQERLSIIDIAQKNITDLSSKVVSLQDILTDKQARGIFGQGRMENIIEDALPKNAYTFQATLSNGKRPDCLVHLPNNPCDLVIDAKFPLEGFEAYGKAITESEKSETAKLIRSHISKHIDDISAKYFIPGETQDTAIMFVPSEAIVQKINSSFPDIIQKAHKSRIIIAAPNMLMLAVQTMQSIMKDVQMREAASLIKSEVGFLMDDIHRLKERVSNLQRHFTKANKDMEQIMTSSDKISSRGTRIENLEFQTEQILPELKSNAG